MEAQKVDMFILANSKYFESGKVGQIRDRLLAVEDAKWHMIQAVQLKDPTTALIISLLGGTLGIDRFYIGDTGLGVGKLLTCGGFSIWAIVDWFLIMDATRDKNMKKIMQYLY